MPDKLTDVTDNNVGKITDSEIVKALECCANCESCDYETTDCPLGEEMECRSLLAKYSLDLINRLQVEKEELVGNIDKLKAELFDKTEQLKTAKTEAYEEFAEWLRAKSWETDTVLGSVKVVAREEISRFLKEKGCESREYFIRSLSKTVKKEINRRADSGTEET